MEARSGGGRGIIGRQSMTARKANGTKKKLSYMRRIFELFKKALCSWGNRATFFMPELNSLSEWAIRWWSTADVKIREKKSTLGEVVAVGSSLERSSDGVEPVADDKASTSKKVEAPCGADEVVVEVEVLPLFVRFVPDFDLQGVFNLPDWGPVISMRKLGSDRVVKDCLVEPRRPSDMRYGVLAVRRHLRYTLEADGGLGRLVGGQSVVSRNQNGFSHDTNLFPKNYKSRIKWCLARQRPLEDLLLHHREKVRERGDWVPSVVRYESIEPSGSFRAQAKAVDPVGTDPKSSGLGFVEKDTSTRERHRWAGGAGNGSYVEDVGGWNGRERRRRASLQRRK